MLPEEAVEEFKEIYKKEFKKELSEKEARERAENLIGLFKVVYGNNKKAKCTI